MNDPHVKALTYGLRHGDAVDYGAARELEFEDAGFRCTVADKRVRFEMVEHFAEEGQAREAVETFIRRWEFEAYMEHGPGWLELEFVDSEVVDRDPSPGVLSLQLSSRVEVTDSFTMTVCPKAYPSPPERSLDVDNQDVQVLFVRYRGYRAGKEPLGSFANFCLTALESSVGGTKGKRAKAAKRYGISRRVLDRIGDLCDKKGGDWARKGRGLGSPFSPEEEQFLETAVRKLIYRVAEYHGSGGVRLSPITMADVREA